MIFRYRVGYKYINLTIIFYNIQRMENEDLMKFRVLKHFNAKQFFRRFRLLYDEDEGWLNESEIMFIPIIGEVKFISVYRGAGNSLCRDQVYPIRIHERCMQTWGVSWQNRLWVAAGRRYSRMRVKKRVICCMPPDATWPPRY